FDTHSNHSSKAFFYLYTQNFLNSNQNPVNPPNNGINNAIINLIQSKYKRIPITIIKIPPNIINRLPCFFKNVILSIKKVIIQKDIENHNTYTYIYTSPIPGLATPSAITPARMGPVQGVHPSANPNPINMEPK